GERVKDCAVPPFSPVAPPYENCVTRFPAASRIKIVRPPFVSASPPEDALKTAAQPKTELDGSKLPPPKTTKASSAAMLVPAANVWRRVSAEFGFALVRKVHPERSMAALVELASSINSSWAASRTPS